VRADRGGAGASAATPASSGRVVPQSRDPFGGATGPFGQCGGPVRARSAARRARSTAATTPVWTPARRDECQSDSVSAGLGRGGWRGGDDEDDGDAYEEELLAARRAWGDSVRRK